VNEARVLFWAGRHDEALEQFRSALSINPENAFAHAEYGLGLVCTSSVDEGTAELEKSRRLSIDLFWTHAYLAYAYMAKNRKLEAERSLRTLKEISNQRYVPGTIIAMTYAALGEKDPAFEWLKRAAQEGASTLVELTNHAFDSLRPDPRFHEILTMIGLS